MKIEYQTTINDFLAFQLFNSSGSRQVNKSKITSTLLLFIIFLIVSIVFFIKDNMFLSIYFGIASILSIFLFPIFYKWKLKKNIVKLCNENYKNIKEEIITLELTGDSIYSSGNMGESRINISEIEKIDETQLHFFIKLNNGLTIIIPKQDLAYSNELRTKLKSHNKEFNSILDWKW